MRHKETGTIYEGGIHIAAWENMLRAIGGAGLEYWKKDEFLKADCEEPSDAGFVMPDGRFLTREEMSAEGLPDEMTDIILEGLADGDDEQD